MTPVEVQQAVDTAVARLNGGRAHDAISLLERAAAAAPSAPEVFRVLGLARKAVRNLAGAEQALARAVALDRKSAPMLVSLADVQAAMGQSDEAEKSYRKALTLDRRNVQAIAGLADLLSRQERHAEALKVTTPAYAALEDPVVSAHHGAALKALGRAEESLAAYERAAMLGSPSGVAEHNVAAGLADVGRYAEAETRARKAQTLGLRAPETLLVLAHALQGQDRLDEAEETYRAAIRARPGYFDAHKDLAQLIWMRTEDVAAASEELDRAIVATTSAAPPLLAAKAQLYAHAERTAEAYEFALQATQRSPSDGQLALRASQYASEAGRAGEAVTHAERGLRLLSGDFAAEATLCDALLASGRADEAALSADRMRRQRPEDQRALALQATAWRLLGDDRYRTLYDYAAFVRPHPIDTPSGWSSLDDYLADLADGLAELHVTRTHPVGQSLRHGSQTNQALLRSQHPAVKAFRTAIDGPIRRYIASLGQGKDPVRSRIRRDYAIAGIWSVRLRPGGFHIDHVHPEGWLSSACYISLPSVVEGEGRQGWIRFGEPGIATEPHLEAEHFVKPEPGMLVLFPSYMWHGTVPFSGDERRMTVAFDLVPK